jgi:hypothetical protein
VKVRPFKHELQCPGWKIAADPGRLDLDGDLVFSVYRVKMRYAVLAVEHADHDAEKSRKSGISDRLFH